MTTTVKTPYHGSCLCGSIAYQVDEILPHMGHCHCRMCRKFSGAAFSTYAEASADSFRWLKGSELLRCYKADNGSLRQFCSKCGSSLIFQASEAATIEFSLGSLDSDIDVKPDVHIYADYKADWYPILDGLPVFREGRDSARLLPRIRDYRSADCDEILYLNHQSVASLSPMDGDRFQQLQTLSDLILVAEWEQRVVGFMMAFCDGSSYDSENYRWFAERYDSFVYVDRIVIGRSARNNGLGKRFYQRLQQWSQQRRKAYLTAEVDLEPRNQVSLDFHQRMGFFEAGQQVYGDARKRVALMVKSIS